MDRLADDLLNLRILDFASGAIGATLGVLIRVTQEALSWLDLNLGPGGTIAIVDGVAAFAVALALGMSSTAAITFATLPVSPQVRLRLK